MKLNVGNFKNVVRKATLNMSFDSVQIKFDERLITSKMISRDNTAIVILELKNDVISGVEGENVLNFVEPNQNLMPFLNLFEDVDEIDFTKTDSALTLKLGRQKSRLRMSVEQAVSIFSRGNPNERVRSFVSFQLDDDFIEAYSKIKKIGARFGKVYFSVESGMLFMETTDREEGLSNSLKMELVPVAGVDDVQLCYNYKNLVNMMTVINSHYADFKLSIASTNVSGTVMGMVTAEKNDGTEKYFIMSQRENI